MCVGQGFGRFFWAVDNLRFAAVFGRARGGFPSGNRNSPGQWRVIRKLSVKGGGVNKLWIGEMGACGAFWLQSGGKWGVLGEFFTLIPEKKLMSAFGRPLFVGKHQRNLDSKNRLTIPSKWRFDGDEEEVFLAMPDGSGAILVLPPKQVEKMFADVEGQKLGDENAQALQDKLFSQAVSFGCDKQGRINLPDELLQEAGIDKEAIMVGRMTTFRIWSPERWAKIDPKANNDDLGKLMRHANL